MKKRFHILIIIGVLLIGFIIGSFLDLQIDQALYSDANPFGLFMASFGVYPCYAGLAFIGGGFLATSYKNKDMRLITKIISYALAIAAYGMAIYLCGKEFPSPNGYDRKDLAWLSYLICAVVFAGVFVWAFFVCRKGDRNYLWKIIVVMTIIFVIALLPAGFLIKLVIHRPRYRYVVRGEITSFYNWWEMFPEYKNYIDSAEHHWSAFGHVITKEEFKSFPSGHSGTGMIMAMFFPFASYFFPRLKGKETLLFYTGVVWGFVMMYSRMLVGAHYLTDTCMGSLIVMIVFYVTNEVAYRKKIYDEEKVIEAPIEDATPAAIE